MRCNPKVLTCDLGLRYCWIDLTEKLIKWQVLAQHMVQWVTPRSSLAWPMVTYVNRLLWRIVTLMSWTDGDHGHCIKFTPQMQSLCCNSLTSCPRNNPQRNPALSIQIQVAFHNMGMVFGKIMLKPQILNWFNLLQIMKSANMHPQL